MDTSELQKAVIGAILVDPDALLVVTDEITPLDMDAKHGAILSHALRLYADGMPIDIGTLSLALGEAGELEKIGGIAYLVKCSDIPTAINAGLHAAQIKERSIKQKLKTWASTVANREMIGEPLDEIGTLNRELSDIADKVKPKKSPEARAIIREIEERQNEIDLAHKEGRSAGLWTPSEFWGDSIPGYYKGHFWTVTGYTSYGKSLLLSSMLVDIMQNGGKVLVFSMEDSRAEKIMGMKGVLSDVPKAWQLRGDINNYRSELLTADGLLVEWEPVIYDDVRTLEDMRLKTKKHILRSGVDVVAIDYIQQIKEPGSLYERMSSAAIFLQSMFKELDVTGIVLSQIDNVTARDGGAIIGAKGGGDIPAASDIVIQINRDKDDKQKVELEIKKNRAFGKTGIRPCRFSDRWTAIEYDYLRGGVA